MVEPTRLLRQLFGYKTECTAGIHRRAGRLHGTQTPTTQGSPTQHCDRHNTVNDSRSSALVVKGRVNNQRPNNALPYVSRQRAHSVPHTAAHTHPARLSKYYAEQELQVMSKMTMFQQPNYPQQVWQGLISQPPGYMARKPIIRYTQMTPV